jgi:taurine dioxygenase
MEETMSDWNEDDGLRWRELAPFGIEIDHDLGAPLSPAASWRFATLFRASGLIVAPGQTLSMAQQIALLERLGPVLRSVDGASYVSGDDADVGVQAELAFHAEYAFSPAPLHALSLHAVDVADGASSTRFANAERALAALPAALRKRLAAHAVEMISPDAASVSRRACEAPEPQAVIRETRPSVLFNPRTGRDCLGVSEMHAARLIGLDREASRDLLTAVYEHLYAPANTVEHVWRRGDLLIWDNITLQHARGEIARSGRRLLQRVAVGEKSLAQMYPQMFAQTG